VSAYLQEPFIEHVDVVAVEGVSPLSGNEGQGATAAAGGEHDAGFLRRLLPRVDDLIGGCVFQEPVLVDAGGV